MKCIKILEKNKCAKIYKKLMNGGIAVNKKERHALIKRIVSEQKIRKQDDLVQALEEEGYEVTQATVSRDIQELQLIKVPDSERGYRYSLPYESEHRQSEKIERVIQSSFLSIDLLREFVWIKTIPGSGEVLGAVIEKAEIEDIFAVIPGDNHILVICQDYQAAEEVRNKIIQYL